MILQDLLFHTNLEWFRQLFDTIHCQYLWQISFLQKKCETRIMKMRVNDAHFRVFFWSFSHYNVKNSLSYLLVIKCASMFQKTLCWCHFELNLLFHMHICVSVLAFVNFGGGYTLRLIKSKLCMILQYLVLHTKLE